MGWTILGYLLLAWAAFEIFVGETYLVGTIRRVDNPLGFWLLEIIYVLIGLWLIGVFYRGS